MTTATTLPARVARRDSEAGDPVAARLSTLLGIRIGTAEQLLRGRDALQVRTAAAIQAFIDAGALDRLSKFYAPIEAAYRRLLHPAHTKALELQAAVADGDEEIAEKAYDLDPSEATARQLVRAIDIERSRQLERRMAIADQWGIR
jgi:hypothetical protein